MTRARVHLDPASLLAMAKLAEPGVPGEEREKFIDALAETVGHLRKWWPEVVLVLSLDHFHELRCQLGRTDCYRSGGRSRDLGRTLRSFLGKHPPLLHEYGASSGAETRILDELDGSLFPADGAVVLAWADLLSSEELARGGRRAPGYAAPGFSLVTDTPLRVEVEGELVEYRFHRSWLDIADELGRVDRETREALHVDGPAPVKWEKTGHRPTVRHQSVVRAVVDRSGIVAAAQSTYHIPSARRPAKVSATSDPAVFELDLPVGNDVWTLALRTNAGTERQSRIALRILEQALAETLAGR